MKSLFSLLSVSKAFDPQNLSLKPTSIEIPANTRIGIVGETGSGKSTFLKLLAGLIQPSIGEINYNDKKVQGPDDRLIPGHEEIAYLSQHFELPKFISVWEYLDDPYLMARDDAELIFKACQITHLLKRDTRALSGGEKQRVALAKLLLKSPRVLLLDEPFSNLDFIHKRIIKQVIEEVELSLKMSILMVTHDPPDVLSWAERIFVFKSGEIVQKSDPVSIYSKPVNTYVAGLFGPYSLLTTSVWQLSNQEQLANIGGKILVRPEQIQVNSSNELKGEVIAIHYYGGYDHVRVLASNDDVIMLSKVGQFKVGEKVSLAVI